MSSLASVPATAMASIACWNAAGRAVSTALNNSCTTECSRTSLLSGRLARGVARQEAQAFAAQKAKAEQGAVTLVFENVPPGLGSHVHWDRRLDARLAGALMGI